MRWLDVARRGAQVVAGGALVCGAGTSVAQVAQESAEAEAEAQPQARVTHERRGGFTVGYSTGLWLGRVEGTPAEEDKIGRDEFRTVSSGVGAGSVLWLGSTITDWFGVALGLGGGTVEQDGKATAISSFHFRVEGYPLYARGGVYRDLGVTLVSGLGFAVVEGEEEDEPRVSGLGASTVGLGVFHETFGFWKFRAGPQLEYAYSFSRPAVAHSFLLGARLVFRLEP